jgi:hypothetical protein
VELKSEKGRVREEQKEWLDRLDKQGYRAVVAYGFDEAAQAIIDYLETGLI